MSASIVVIGLGSALVGGAVGLSPTHPDVGLVAAGLVLVGAGHAVHLIARHVRRFVAGRGRPS